MAGCRQGGTAARPKAPSGSACQPHGGLWKFAGALAVAVATEASFTDRDLRTPAKIMGKAFWAVSRIKARGFLCRRIRVIVSRWCHRVSRKVEEVDAWVSFNPPQPPAECP